MTECVECGVNARLREELARVAAGRDEFAREILAVEWEGSKGAAQDPCCPFCLADARPYKDEPAHREGCVVLKAREALK